MDFIVTRTKTKHLDENEGQPCKNAFRTGWGVKIKTLLDLTSFIMENGKIIISMDGSNPKIEIYDAYREQNKKMKIKPPSKGQNKIQPFSRRGKKVGRNDLCPCGSSKKYKHCCLPKIKENERPPKIKVEKKKSFKRTKKK